MDYETEYAVAHPDWHLEDTDDKVGDVLAAIRRSGLRPRSIADVGCGAGAVLAGLHAQLGTARAVGYDIAPYALGLAREHHGEVPGLEYVHGDAAEDPEHFDVLLLLDVIEHVSDPVGFLVALRPKADALIVNVPLELSLMRVASPTSLLRGRQVLGHINYFNEAVAVATLEEAGWSVADTQLSPPGTARDVPEPSRRVLREIQRRAGALHASLAARTVGGYSLVLTAR